MEAAVRRFKRAIIERASAVEVWPDLIGTASISPIGRSGNRSRRRAWTHVIPFFAFPPAVRRLIYTTNALESGHAQLRKIITTRGYSPNDEAAMKLIWLALRNITATWARGVPSWRRAMNQFAILYEDRFTAPSA